MRRKQYERYEEMEQIDISLKMLLDEFIVQVEKEYKMLHYEIEESFSDKNASAIRAEHSIELAKMCHVEEDRIVRSNRELDEIMLGNKEY